MIVVFGSLNADMVFQVPVLPGPGETVLTERYVLVPGGKGANQAVVASRAGATTVMAGCVGQDTFGDLLIDTVGRAGVEMTGVGRSESPTGCATICVDSRGQNQIAVAGGANLSARESQIPDGWLTPATYVLLQMEVRPEENWSLAMRAHKAGARIILNAAPATPVPPTIIKLLEALIVNESESLVVAEAAGIWEKDPVEAARGIAREFRTTCIVTLGEAGVRACMPNGEWRAGGLRIAAVDTTGAGDAFTGVFAAALDAGYRLPEAIHRASIGGGLACLIEGAQCSMPKSEQIQVRLDDLPFAQWIPIAEEDAETSETE